MFEAMFEGRLSSPWRRLRRAAALMAGALALTWAAPAPAKTVYFPHQDSKFLYRFQRNGGAALLPEGGGNTEPLPLVVFLHGTNPNGETHMWFGGGGRDLRPLARRLIAGGQVQPFVLAAPSQTKNAGLAAKVWQDFDLNAFVDDVVGATEGQAQINRARVVLVGHSGAGCNPSGGLAADFWSAGVPLPLALVSIDPCLDRKMGRALSRRPSEVPLLLWWQPALWVRQPEKFEAALLRNKPDERVDRVQELPPKGPNPHEAILPIAFESALRELLGSSDASDASDAG